MLIEETATPEELGALFRRLQKRLAELILAGQLTAHPGYAPGEGKPARQANNRNGSSTKAVLTGSGALPLDIPRDRDGTITPQLALRNIVDAWDRGNHAWHAAMPRLHSSSVDA